MDSEISEYKLDRAVVNYDFYLKLMKNFTFAALAAVVAAEAGAPVNTPMTPVYFPTATAGDGLTADASLNEIVQTTDYGYKFAVMWAQFTTTCNDCLIQNDALV